MQRELKPIQKNHLPNEKNIELETELDKKVKKAKRLNDEREKQGKFYPFTHENKKCSIWIKNGINAKEHIEKYVKLLNERINCIRKIKM